MNNATFAYFARKYFANEDLEELEEQKKEFMQKLYHCLKDNKFRSWLYSSDGAKKCAEEIKLLSESFGYQTQFLNDKNSNDFLISIKAPKSNKSFTIEYKNYKYYKNDSEDIHNTIKISYEMPSKKGFVPKNKFELDKLCSRDYYTDNCSEEEMTTCFLKALENFRRL